MLWYKLLANSDHKSPFINNGFTNWKKAFQRFSEHERSNIHHEAVEKLAAKASSVHIGAQLSSIKATEIIFHKSTYVNERFVIHQVPGMARFSTTGL